MGNFGQFFTGFGGQNFLSVQLGATTTLFKGQIRVCGSEEVEKLIEQTELITVSHWFQGPKIAYLRQKTPSDSE